MFSTFMMMLNKTLGLLLLILVGYFLRKKKLVPDSTSAVLSKLVTQLFVPALVFNSFFTKCTPENFKNYASYILIGGIVIAISVVLAYPLSALIGRGADQYEKNVIRYSLAIPNTGGFGIPIVSAAFGPDVLFSYNLFLLVNNILCFSWGLGQLIPSADGKKKSFLKGLKELILRPQILAMFVGAFFGLTGIAAHVPVFLTDTVNRLHDCYTASALILVGFAIAEFKIKDIIGSARIYWVTLFRLVLLPAAYLIVMRLIGMSYELRVMTCMLIACPCGMNSVVFAAAYGKDTKPGAGTVLITSLLAIITIPIFYALV